MVDFANATPFGARAMPSADRDGRDLILIVVAARFDLPRPHQEKDGLRLSETQDPPPLADEYCGEPGQSSLRLEGQTAYTRPATDIYISGSACAPGERAITHMSVGVRVGPCSMGLAVSGDRVWQRAVGGGARPSPPKPFVRMPVVWERAYGGLAVGSTEQKPAFEPRNPVGCGLETSAGDAIDKPVPNIEDPNALITTLADRPRPIGVAPIARHWRPRLGYAGTYDDQWRRRRAPLWPLDLDERFFCGAPSELQARPHLRGGEGVVLNGWHAEGPIIFNLPWLRLISRSHFVDRVAPGTLMLDGLLIDTEALRLTMYYRASVHANFVRHRATLLRLLEPWEDHVAT